MGGGRGNVSGKGKIRCKDPFRDGVGERHASREAEWGRLSLGRRAPRGSPCLAGPTGTARGLGSDLSDGWTHKCRGSGGNEDRPMVDFQSSPNPPLQTGGSSPKSGCRPWYPLVLSSPNPYLSPRLSPVPPTSPPSLESLILCRLSVRLLLSCGHGSLTLASSVPLSIPNHKPREARPPPAAQAPGAPGWA